MKTTREPPIVIVREDFERLKAFTMAVNLTPVAEFLDHELERAEVVDSLDKAANVVRLGSRVHFQDVPNGQLREVTLVMPDEANIDAGRISVMTPVGAALLGMSADQEIKFTLPNGNERALKVVAIENS